MPHDLRASGHGLWSRIISIAIIVPAMCAIFTCAILYGVLSIILYPFILLLSPLGRWRGYVTRKQAKAP